MTSFLPPSATGTPQQQQQVQLERDLTMVAITIMTWCRQQDSSGTRATTITTMAITKYNVRISNNNIIMSNARNTNKLYKRNAIRQWQSCDTERRTAVTQATSNTRKWNSRPRWSGISNSSNKLNAVSNSNTTMANVVPMQLNPSETRTWWRWRGGKVGNDLDSECGVDNGLDRGRVDVVDKMPARSWTPETIQ